MIKKRDTCLVPRRVLFQAVVTLSIKQMPSSSYRLPLLLFGRHP